VFVGWAVPLGDVWWWAERNVRIPRNDKRRRVLVGYQRPAKSRESRRPWESHPTVPVSSPTVPKTVPRGTARRGGPSFCVGGGGRADDPLDDGGWRRRRRRTAGARDAIYARELKVAVTPVIYVAFRLCDYNLYVFARHSVMKLAFDLYFVIILMRPLVRTPPPPPPRDSRSRTEREGPTSPDRVLTFPKPCDVVPRAAGYRANRVGRVRSRIVNSFPRRDDEVFERGVRDAAATTVVAATTLFTSKLASPHDLHTCRGTDTASFPRHTPQTRILFVPFVA